MNNGTVGETVIYIIYSMRSEHLKFNSIWSVNICKLEVCLFGFFFKCDKLDLAFALCFCTLYRLERRKDCLNRHESQNISLIVDSLHNVYHLICIIFQRGEDNHSQG